MLMPFLLFTACFVAVAEPTATAEGISDLSIEQIDALDIEILATPTEIHFGDIVFVKISLINTGDRSVLLPSRPIPDWSLYLNDWNHDIRFSISPVGGGFGMTGPRNILPGGRLAYPFSDRQPMAVPPLPNVTEQIWSPRSFPDARYRLSFQLSITNHINLVGGGPVLVIHPRPEAEMTKLVEMCRYRPQTRRDFPPDWDYYAPSLDWFGFMSSPPMASTPENLAALDELLSPGTLRDFVRLTRRVRELYDTVVKGPFGEDSSSQPAEGMGAARRKLAALLDWLETFPDVQRQCMTGALADWASNSVKGTGNFAYEIAVEAALRPSLVDGDLAARRTWLKSRMQSPLAAPYLEDFEERFKTIE